jgi:hypothetical protein
MSEKGLVGWRRREADAGVAGRHGFVFVPTREAERRLTRARRPQAGRPCGWSTVSPSGPRRAVWAGMRRAEDGR